MVFRIDCQLLVHNCVLNLDLQFIVSSNVTYRDGILLILGSVSVRGGRYPISIFCSQLDFSNQRLIWGKKCSESVQKSSVQKSTDTHKHHFSFYKYLQL